MKFKLFMCILVFSVDAFSYIDALIWDNSISQNIELEFYGKKSVSFVSCAQPSPLVINKMDFCKRNAKVVEHADLMHEVSVINNTFQALAQELPEEIIHNQKVLDKIRMIVREEIERAQKESK